MNELFQFWIRVADHSVPDVSIESIAYPVSCEERLKRWFLHKLLETFRF